jgi:hypothetical protein
MRCGGQLCSACSASKARLPAYRQQRGDTMSYATRQAISWTEQGFDNGREWFVSHYLFAPRAGR